MSAGLARDGSSRSAPFPRRTCPDAWREARPTSVDSRVDLPAPLRPITATTSPSRTSRSTPRRTGWPPRRTTRRSTEQTAGADPGDRLGPHPVGQGRSPGRGPGGGRRGPRGGAVSSRGGAAQPDHRWVDRRADHRLGGGRGRPTPGRPRSAGSGRRGGSPVRGGARRPPRVRPRSWTSRVQACEHVLGGDGVLSADVASSSTRIRGPTRDGADRDVLLLAGGEGVCSGRLRRCLPRRAGPRVSSTRRRIAIREEPSQ